MTKPRVLMVDDEVEFLNAMVKVLRKREMDVTGVSSGSEALAALRGEPIDVVLLDYMMPGMNGMDALREIKKQWPYTEVIMLTAVGSVESGIEGMRRGAFDFVLKPADIDELVDKIRQAYERKVLHSRDGV